ncbi:MAG: hypothetical protein QXE05_11550 [Nitrososphaeria archaeon]
MGYSSPPSSYTPLMLSHQTGLSVTASTANTFYTIGSAISIPRSGIIVISMAGHGTNGSIQLQLTRGSSTYKFGNYYETTGTLYNSMFGNVGSNNGQNYIASSSPIFLYTEANSNGNTNIVGANLSFILPVYAGDSLQFYATNNTSGGITYVDDLLVMLI